MGGATFVCGSFEGNDKSASPIVSVMEEAFVQAFGRKPRGRLARWLAARLGRASMGEVALAEEAILHVRFNEEGEIPPRDCRTFSAVFRALSGALAWGIEYRGRY